MSLLLAAALVVTPAGTWRDNHVHLRVSYPTDWHVTTTSLTPITQPVQRVTVYSGSMPRPMGPPRVDQVLAIVMEQTNLQPGDLAHFPPRPTHFRIKHLGMLEGFNGRSWGEIVFRDHQRGFYVFVGVGAHARPQLPKLVAALDSLRVGP